MSSPANDLTYEDAWNRIAIGLVETSLVPPTRAITVEVIIGRDRWLLTVETNRRELEDSQLYTWRAAERSCSGLPDEEGGRHYASLDDVWSDVRSFCLASAARAEEDEARRGATDLPPIPDGSPLPSRGAWVHLTLCDGMAIEALVLNSVTDSWYGPLLEIATFGEMPYCLPLGGVARIEEAPEIRDQWIAQIARGLGHSTDYDDFLPYVLLAVATETAR